METNQIIKSINDSHCHLIMELLLNMSKQEFESIPAITYSVAEKQFIEANGIAIDTIFGVRVYSLGGPFFKIKTAK